MASAPVVAAVPPLRGTALLTEVRLDSALPVLLAVVACLYLYGVHRLRVRGDRWPVLRTVMFLGLGLGSIALVTLSGIGAYDDTLLSIHMIQHMVLSMIAPIFLALGAPVTLALRTLSGRYRRALLAVIHSRVVRVLTFPLVAYGLFVVNPFVLYFTPLYRATLDNGLLHEWVHLHFVITGCLFFWPLIGLDPLPGRWPYPGRALLMVLSTPFHAVLGLTIMQDSTLIGNGWYQSLHLSWVDPRADQVLAGGILWSGGEVVSLTMIAVVVVQWMRESDREAKRVDRALDREARRAAPVPDGSPTAAADPTAVPAPGAPGPAPDDEQWEVPWWQVERPERAYGESAARDGRGLGGPVERPERAYREFPECSRLSSRPQTREPHR